MIEKCHVPTTVEFIHMYLISESASGSAYSYELCLKFVLFSDFRMIQIIFESSFTFFTVSLQAAETGSGKTGVRFSSIACFMYDDLVICNHLWHPSRLSTMGGRTYNILLFLHSQVPVRLFSFPFFFDCCPVDIYWCIKWATSRENLSSRVCDQVRLKPACSATDKLECWTFGSRKYRYYTI